MKRTFIYDTSKVYSSFIRKKFSDKMILNYCKKSKNFKNYNLLTYDICFFNVMDIDDFILLRKAYFEIELLFVTSPKKIFIDKINNLNYDNIILIDISHSKTDIINEIDLQLSLLK